jgi:hypothetical protein
MRRLLRLFIFLPLLLIAQGGFCGIADQDPQKGQKSKQIPQEEEHEPNLDGVVEVSFKIDNVGKVQILNINSTSPQLADYVIKKLGKIQLEQGNSQVGKVIRYRFVFKKQA